MFYFYIVIYKWIKNKSWQKKNSAKSNSTAFRAAYVSSQFGGCRQLSGSVTNWYIWPDEKSVSCTGGDSQLCQNHLWQPGGNQWRGPRHRPCDQFCWKHHPGCHWGHRWAVNSECEYTTITKTPHRSRWCEQTQESALQQSKENKSLVSCIASFDQDKRAVLSHRQ